MIRSAVEQGMYHTAKVPKRPMTISIGLYQESPMKETDMERFIFRADQALYEAKRMAGTALWNTGSSRCHNLRKNGRYSNQAAF